MIPGNRAGWRVEVDVETEKSEDQFTSDLRQALAVWRHDLRTPVTGLLGYAQLIFEDVSPLPEGVPWTEPLSAIAGGARHLLVVINELLQVAGPEEENHLSFYRRSLEQGMAPTLGEIQAHIATLRIILETSPFEHVRPDLDHLQHALTQVRDLISGGPDRPQGVELTAELARMAPITPEDVEQGRLVLVVDDQEGNRDILSRRLLRMGHRVMTASDGTRAMEALHRWPVDLVLLDLLMPGMSGWQVLELMRADPKLKSVPVIVATTFDDPASIAGCLALGADDLLAKPVDPLLLQMRVRICLENIDLRRKVEETAASFSRIAAGVSALEQGDIEPPDLTELATRRDEVGSTARSLLSLARYVAATHTPPAFNSPR